MTPSRACAVLLVGLSFATSGESVQAASHLWRFNEIFSNASGTVQFIEMKECCGADTETLLDDKWVECIVAGNRFTFDRNLIPPTTNKHLLLATAGFAALPGAPTPDFIASRVRASPSSVSPAFSRRSTSRPSSDCRCAR